MKKILIYLFLLALASCANPQVAESPNPVTTTITTNIPFPHASESVTTQIIPTNTSLALPITQSVTPTITFTPDPPCDPFITDYCITDGHLILQRPIQPPANDLIDPGYGYGSTANGTRDPHHGVEF